MPHCTNSLPFLSGSEGALRNAVHNYLRKNRVVKSYRLGEYGEPHCTNSLPFLSGSELTVPFSPMDTTLTLSPGLI